jgi:hypothetical protein
MYHDGMTHIENYYKIEKKEFSYESKLPINFVFDIFAAIIYIPCASDNENC